MPQKPYNIAGFDVRRLASPDSTRRHIIGSMTVPSIKHKTTEFTAGGGFGTVNYVLPQIEALEPKFATRGPDLDAFSAVGLVVGATDTWVFAGAYIQRSGAAPVPFRAIIAGTLAEIEPGEASVGDGQDWTHSLQEVTHCELHLGGESLWTWDHESGLIVRGKDYGSVLTQALGI